MSIQSRLRNLRITDCHGLVTDFRQIPGQSRMSAPGARKSLRSAVRRVLHAMMMAPLSGSHRRGRQGTPYLRQTSSGGVGECGGRCRTCPASKYDPPGVLGHHQHLQLALVERASLPLRPLSTLLSPCTRGTTGRKGVLYKEEDPRSLAGGASPGCCSCEGWVGARGQAPAERKGRLPQDESVIEMESVCGHCSPNQPS